MVRELLRDDQWERIKDLLPGKARDCGVTAKDNRKFLEAVLWIARTGSPWRDLPQQFGPWHRVYVRDNRWCHKGHWERIFEAVSGDPDLTYLMVDGSVVRVHQHGAAKKNTTREEGMGKSRGGLSTKIHAAVDALGNPLRLLLSPGQSSEMLQAQALIVGIRSDYVIADKGYDADGFIQSIQRNGSIPVIVPRSHRKTPGHDDKHLYPERNPVERVFQELRHYRRIATRYERLAVTYMAVLCLVSTVIWLN